MLHSASPLVRAYILLVLDNDVDTFFLGLPLDCLDQGFVVGSNTLNHSRAVSTKGHCCNILFLDLLLSHQSV